MAKQVAKKSAKKESTKTFPFKKQLSILLAAFAIILYVNSWHNGYVLDDFSIIKENNIVNQGTKSIGTIFKTSYRYGYFNMDDGLYRPLTLAMFAFEWEHWPNNPHVSHLVNIILYAALAVILFLTLAELFASYSILLPFAATAFFIAHPVHTEVVSNIKSRDEILCFGLSFLSFYFLLKQKETTNAKLILFATLSFFLALLSKESGITMLAVIPLGLFLFSKLNNKTIIASTAALLIITAIYLIIRSKVLHGNLTDGGVAMIDNILVSAKDAGTRYGTATFILGKYLLLLIAPLTLRYDYSFNHIPLVNFGEASTLISLLVHGALVFIAIKNINKNKVLAFAILYYFITISLFSNIPMIIGAAMAERFIFFSSLGFCIALAWIITRYTSTETFLPIQSLKHFLSTYNKSFMFIAALLVFYSFKTVQRNPQWKDNHTLYSHDIESLDNSSRAHYYLGNNLVKTVAVEEKDPGKKKEYFELGIKHLERSLEIYPSYSDAYSQLGVAYYRLNNLPKAEEYYLKALKYHPNEQITLNNLASVYFSTGKYNEAIEMYKKVIVLNPRYTDALMNLGNCLGMLRRYSEAIPYFEKVIEINPNEARAYYFMSVTYKFMNDLGKADLYMKKAVELEPGLAAGGTK